MRIAIHSLSIRRFMLGEFYTHLLMVMYMHIGEFSNSDGGRKCILQIYCSCRLVRSLDNGLFHAQWTTTHSLVSCVMYPEHNSIYTIYINLRFLHLDNHKKHWTIYTHDEKRVQKRVREALMGAKLLRLTSLVASSQFYALNSIYTHVCTRS